MRILRDINEQIPNHIIEKKHKQKVGKQSKLILASQTALRKYSFLYKFSVPEGGVFIKPFLKLKKKFLKEGGVFIKQGFFIKQ